MEKTSVNLNIEGKTLILETGRLAQQASSSVLARLGDTMVLATVVEGTVREDLGYFPLSVEYVERLYAGGKIKGSRWVKREGRPSDEAVLTARLIDRSIRPLFPKEYKNEVQIVVTVLSVDGENEPDILSILAVSAALHLSSIPWKGPISSVRVGFIEDKSLNTREFIINPRTPEIVLSELDLIVSQTEEKTHMIEAGGRQVEEKVILEALQKAQEVNKTIIEFIEKLASSTGQKKTEITPNGLLKEIATRIEKSHKEELIALITARAKKEASGSDDDLITRILEEEKMANPENSIDKKTIAKAVEIVFYKLIRQNILVKGERPDGRKVDEIRPINSEVGILPRTHGSAIFQRGNTQALTIATLGSPRLEQLIESAEGEETKRYMHHYSMPPYSVGETGRMGVPSRREIGHGALAERALLPVIPPQGKFPYTIRVVSEIMSSNGSTSMAATCGSTLALMDAGVPIVKPVGGIAMGMMSDEKNYVILTDIIGLEDFSGDMDFKVAGTDSGITAIQLDVKILGLSIKQVEEILEKAKKARIFILEKMLSVIPSSRTEISAYAPKIEQIQIPTDKIGEVIGPGGRVIRGIIAETGAEVEVDDSGIITVSGTKEEAVEKARAIIEGLTRELKVGEEFEGEIKRILPFGAFVEVLPGKEGMVHVSKMSTEYVRDPNDIVKIGDRVKVKVVEIDEQGRTNLSMVGDKETQTQQHRPQNEHPLSRQFRRERSYDSRDSRGRGRSSDPRFKKTHF